jgi:predicted RNA polymerase sigma factor
LEECGTDFSFAVAALLKGRRVHSITNRERLATYPFYFAAIGELELQRGRPETAREQFQTALALARNSMERQFLGRRVSACE